MLATGREKLERMRDGRVVYIGAERVDDVTTPSGVPQRRADDRGALRSQGRSGEARSVHLRGERRAHRPAMAALPHPRRSRAPHARHEGDRGRDLWPDRPLARSCRRPDHRARDAAGAARRPAPGFGDNLHALLRARAPRTTSISRFAVTPPSGIRDREIYHRRSSATIRPCRWWPRTMPASPCRA